MPQTIGDYGLFIQKFAKTKIENSTQFQAPPYYSLHLVTEGEGFLHYKHVEYELKRGSIFMTLPHGEYNLKGVDNLACIHIDFMGPRGAELAKNLLDLVNTPIFPGYEFQIDFWEDALRKSDEIKSNLIAQGVLFYTLGCIPGRGQLSGFYKKREYIMIQSYIRSNFTNPDLSLEQVANAFGYNKKYLSDMFKKRFDISFTDFLKKLRLEHALSMIQLGNTSVSKIASLCGFSDPLYFSKLFKKAYGVSPKNYVINLKQG